MAYIYIVSDGTGRTAKQTVSAALTQFPLSKVEIRLCPYIGSETEVKKIIKEVKDINGFIVHTIVTDELRDKIIKHARKNNIETIDLMGPLLGRLSEQLAISPTEKPGLFGQLNEEYFRRIETMEYAIQHDDGLNADNIGNAEIVLLGVSRTFKTPLSIYLAFKGWFVANVPILVGSKPPEILLTLPKGKVFCLDTNPRSLCELRRPRESYLKNSTGEYTDFEFIRIELMNARNFFRSNPDWPVINVANKPIEEIASEILSLRASAVK